LLTFYLYAKALNYAIIFILFSVDIGEELVTKEFVEDYPIPIGGYPCLLLPKNIDKIFHSIADIDKAVPLSEKAGAVIIDIAAGDNVADDTDFESVPETPDALLQYMTRDGKAT
jgi:hypothetical protein